MVVRSEFIKSELLIWREGCEVIDRGDHLSVKSRTNPNWRWGNLLIMEQPPTRGDLQKWLHAFERAFPEGLAHRMFVWDDPDGNEGDHAEFVEAGYRLQHDHLLAANELIPPAPAKLNVSYREIGGPEEWESVILANAAAFGPDIPGYDRFVRGLLAIHGSLVNKGEALWLCAYVNGALAGSCGVLNGPGFSRYQEVSVSQRFQNNGIASNLVFEAARLAIEKGYARPFYMVADIDTQAERIYRRLGFNKLETTSSLRRIPEDEATVG